MKRIILCFLAFLYSGCLLAHEVMQPHIDVVGIAKIEVEPDLIIWKIVVKNIGADLSTVSGSHSKSVKNIISTIRSNKIDKKMIQTSGMQFGENKVYRDRSWIKEGFLASTSISFTLSDFKAYEALWVALSKVKGVSVEDVYYDHSDRVNIQEKVRNKALLAAKAKAHSMASTLGVEVGQAISISEITNSYSRSSNVVEFDGEDNARGDGSSISLGTISITKKVGLVMSLIPQ